MAVTAGKTGASDKLGAGNRKKVRIASWSLWGDLVSIYWLDERGCLKPISTDGGKGAEVLRKLTTQGGKRAWSYENQRER